MTDAALPGDRPGNVALLFAPDRLRRIARIAAIMSLVALAVHRFNQTAVGLTDGIDRPFGDDFINFWSGSRLAAAGRVAEVYDFARFHQFQESVAGAPIDVYHYSYSPAMMLLGLPFAALPYVPGWALWTFGGWLAFAFTVAAAWPGTRRADAWLYAAAVPAVLTNAASGQNGGFTAALFGGGVDRGCARADSPGHAHHGHRLGLAVPCPDRLGQPEALPRGAPPASVRTMIADRPRLQYALGEPGQRRHQRGVLVARRAQRRGVGGQRGAADPAGA